MDNVFLYDIDDLKLSVEANIRLREVEAIKAEEIITEETEQLVRWYKSLDAVPMIVSLKEKAEAIREMEITRTLDKLSSLTPAEKEVVEALTHSIVNKLLHGPLTMLKEEAHATNGNMMMESVRKLFLLDEVKTTPQKNLPKAGEEKT